MNPHHFHPGRGGPCNADHGPGAFAANIAAAAVQNRNFRTAFWTGDSLQMTLMHIPPQSEVGHRPIHPCGAGTGSGLPGRPAGKSERTPVSDPRLRHFHTGRSLAQHPQCGSLSSEAILHLCAAPSSPGHRPSHQSRRRPGSLMLGGRDQSRAMSCRKKAARIPAIPPPITAASTSRSPVRG